MRADEFEFANDVRAALEERAPRTAWLLVLAIAVLLAAGAAWASWAKVEEVTVGSGKVIPSSQVQVVQSLDRGIVREILVREGDLVERNQVLMRIDDTTVASQLGELRQRRFALQAEIARLEAEAAGADTISNDPELLREAASVVRLEADAFAARRSKLKHDLAALQEQKVQKEYELRELKANETKLMEMLEPLSKELSLTRDMYKRGVVPQIDLLRLDRQEAQARGELNAVRAEIPAAEAAIAEVNSRLALAKADFEAQARERLAKARSELAVIEESIKAARERVVQTTLRAPVRGVINKVNINTIGAVAPPGQDLIEIVPLDDTLLIEAQIRPQDVAFIRPHQPATVRLTAYDYRIYGGLEGRVERISADTLTDQKGETYYRVIVRTERTYIEKNGVRHPIIPGMVATVDILTGDKSVLDYLLRPIATVRHEALRER